jgi:hypothetical protein
MWIYGSELTQSFNKFAILCTEKSLTKIAEIIGTLARTTSYRTYVDHFIIDRLRNIFCPCGYIFVSHYVFLNHRAHVFLLSCLYFLANRSSIRR